MKVILLENVKRIGSIGEVIDVKRGFARNFLIANKKALYASKENIKEVEKIKSDLAKKDNDKKAEAQKILAKINNKEYGEAKTKKEANMQDAFVLYILEKFFKFSLNKNSLKCLSYWREDFDKSFSNHLLEDDDTYKIYSQISIHRLESIYGKIPYKYGVGKVAKEVINRIDKT